MKHTTKLLSIIAVTCMLLGLMGCQPTTGNIGCSHSWDKGVIKTEATCTTNGLKLYTCEICGEPKTEEIPALGHNFAKTSSVEPTCTTKGYEVHTCSREGCGETKNCKFVDALGHKWSVVHDDSEWECDNGNHNNLTCGENDFLVYVFESETSNKSDFIDIIVLEDILKDDKDTVKYSNLESKLGKKIAMIKTNFGWFDFSSDDNTEITSPVWIIFG